MIPFQQCPNCFLRWNTISEFVEDADLHLITYEANPLDPNAGLLVFEHHTAECKGEMKIPAEAFRSLYDGPIYPISFYDEDDCSHLCKTGDCFLKCTLPCTLNWIREIFHIFHDHQMPAHA